MINICVIICLLIGFFVYKFEKKLTNPLTLMSWLWGIILFLSSLRFWTLYKAKEETYILFTVGIGMFAAGYFTNWISTKKKGIYFTFGNKKGTFKDEVCIRYRLCYFLAIICILFIIYKMSKYGIIGMGLNLSKLGILISNSDVSDRGIINAIGFLIVSPLYITITVVWGLDFFLGKKDRLLTSLIVIMTIGRIFISGGRQPLIQLFIICLTCMSYMEKKYSQLVQNQFKKNSHKKNAILLLVVFVIAFMLLTVTKTTAVWKTLYLNFAMQPYMFEMCAKRIDGQYAYGFASLFGIIHPILYLLKNLLQVIPNMPIFFADIYNNIQNTFSEWVAIGTTLRANAYASSFWYLYYDAGTFGVCVGMFIWGIIAYNWHIKSIRFPNLRNIGMYAMMSIAILYTFTDMEFFKASFVLSIVYLYFIMFSKKVNSER